MAKVSFIGLGVMGYPMAGHISSILDATCDFQEGVSGMQNYNSFIHQEKEPQLKMELAILCGKKKKI